MRQRKDSGSGLESTYKTKIRYKCPKRGWVEEEVEVKRFKAIVPPNGAVFEAEIEEIQPEDDSTS